MKNLKKREKVYFSSKSDEWSTPQDFFDRLNARFHFTLDVCATKENAKCSKYFTSEEDGLKQSWGKERVFMNPPYSEIKIWMRKAYLASLFGALVVCLVPSRTDTRWWHRHAVKGEQEFVKGRLKFGDAKASAPFPSVVIIFRPKKGIIKLCQVKKI